MGTKTEGRTSLNISLNSSCAAWPETWTCAHPPCTTRAPARMSFAIRRETMRSRPGMTREEKRTRSPGWIFTSGCWPAAMRASADRGSAWEPAAKTSICRAGVVPVSASSSSTTSASMVRWPRSRARVTFSVMRRPAKATLRPKAPPMRAIRSMRGIDEEKQVATTRPAAPSKAASIPGITSSSWPVTPGVSAPVESPNMRSTPRRPHSAKASRFVRSAAGAVFASLKSPVCRITSPPHSITKATDPGVECATGSE